MRESAHHDATRRGPEDVPGRRMPLRTAPSMVAGQPVSVQAPARATPPTGVAAPGRRAACPGAAAKVACGSLTTAVASSAGRAGAGQEQLELGAHRRRELGARAPRSPRGRRRSDSARWCDGAVAAAHGGAVEDPLGRAVHDGREGLVHHRAVVPDVHVHDRRRPEARVLGEGVRRDGPGPCGREGERRPRRRASRSPSASRHAVRARPGDRGRPAITAPAPRPQEVAGGGVNEAGEAHARPADRPSPTGSPGSPRRNTNAASAADTRSLRSLQVGSTMRSQKRANGVGALAVAGQPVGEADPSRRARARSGIAARAPSARSAARLLARATGAGRRRTTGPRCRGAGSDAARRAPAAAGAVADRHVEARAGARCGGACPSRPQQPRCRPGSSRGRRAGRCRPRRPLSGSVKLYALPPRNGPPLHQGDLGAEPAASTAAATPARPPAATTTRARAGLTAGPRRCAGPSAPACGRPTARRARRSTS